MAVTHQSVVIALILGSLFYNLEPTSGNGRVFLGAAYRLVLYSSTCGGIETALAMAGKGVFYKMRTNGWYPGWVHAAAPLIVGMSYQLVDAMVWTLICYFMFGYASSPGCFFIACFTNFGVSVAYGALFRRVMLVSEILLMLLQSTQEVPNATCATILHEHPHVFPQ